MQNLLVVKTYENCCSSCKIKQHQHLYSTKKCSWICLPYLNHFDFIDGNMKSQNVVHKRKFLSVTYRKDKRIRLNVASQLPHYVLNVQNIIHEWRKSFKGLFPSVEL